MPKGNKPIPAEMAMLFPVCIPRNGCPKKEEPGVLGSRKGGGRCPAGRVGMDGSFLYQHMASDQVPIRIDVTFYLGSFSSRPLPYTGITLSLPHPALHTGHVGFLDCALSHCAKQDQLQLMYQ